MTASSEHRLRADARRNRDQIVAAASRLFARGGADAPMEEIARAASVGVGTLYRRFPDREALIVAVAGKSTRDLHAQLEAARAEEPTAWAALERFLREAVDMRLMAQLLVRQEAAAERIRADREIARGLDRNTDILQEMVTDAQTEGSMRTDVGLGDVLLLYTGIIVRSAGLPDNTIDDATDRSVLIMLDGLRAGPNDQLPGRAMTALDVGVPRWWTGSRGRGRSRPREG